MPATLHQALHTAFDERNVGDYGVAAPYPRQAAERLLVRAEEFVGMVEAFLQRVKRESDDDAEV